jgi:hypothetical protein
MQCGHCLRGEPQNKHMDIQYLRNFLNQVSYISSVAFTGGEPTLPSGINVIYDFMEVCNQYGVDVGSFYIVTNAKVWRDEIPAVIERLYNFCSDNEVSCIDISADQFHEQHEVRRRQRFKIELEEILEYQYGLTEIVSQRPDHINWDNIIDEGRGANFGTGKYYELPEIHVEQWDDNGELRVTEGDIYLNCHGNIIAGCDWSYESQEDPENIICASDEDLEKAILEFSTTVNETV